MLSQAVRARIAGTDEEYRGIPNQLSPPAFPQSYRPGRTFACAAIIPEPIQPYVLPKIPMTDHTTPFAQFSLERAIALRWMLRDIKAKRLKLSPVGAGDLATLTELGLIEMRDDAPVLTQAGHNALD
jgi:hypothetical protein